MSQLISIIIPVYNRESLIIETLNSILAQTYNNWECIIVDDGSIDTTLEVVQEFAVKDKRFSFFSRPENRLKGPSSSRNFGIEKSQGDFIIFLDSDDLLSSDCLFNRLEFAQNNLQFDFFIFKTELFKTKVGDLNRIFNLEQESYSDENYLNWFLQGATPFCVSSVLWKADRIKLLGGFNEKMTILEDPELHIRAFRNHFKSITSNLKADNYYRKNNDQAINIEKNQQKLLQTVYYLFSLYLNYYPGQMRNYSLNFYRVQVLLKPNFNSSYKFYRLFLSTGILNFSQKIIIPILILYKVLGIENSKGLGFYRLTKKYIKQETPTG